MKHAKKFVSLLLAVVMTMALGISGFAANTMDAGTTSGTITIKNASKGETYSIYKIFDAEVNPQNTDAVRYKVPDGSNFTTNDYFEVDAEGYVTVKEAGKSADGLSTDAIDYLKKYVEAGNVTATQTKTAEGGALVFENVPFGYYFISSTLGAAVTVNTNHPDATVSDKNTKDPEWHPEDPDKPNDVVGKTIKTDAGNVEEKDYKIGDIVTFQIKIDTTNYKGEDKITSYLINDVLPDGMEFVAIDSVKAGDADATYGATNGGFPIKVVWVDENNNSLYPNNTVLTVTYRAKVKEDAQIAGNGNVNTASFNYKTDKADTPDDPKNPTPEDPSKGQGTTKEDTATVTTYALAFVKVDGKTGQKLADATFELPFYVHEVDGKYVVCGENDEGATKTVTTPENGEILILGVDLGEYTIKETKAPNGYNKIEDFTVTAVKTSETKTDTTVYLDESGKVTETKTNTEVTYKNDNYAATAKVIVNLSGSVLPSTGGMGTKMLYIVGAILALSAGLALIVRKRMNGQNA